MIGCRQHAGISAIISLVVGRMIFSGRPHPESNREFLHDIPGTDDAVCATSVVLISGSEVKGCSINPK